MYITWYRKKRAINKQEIYLLMDILTDIFKPLNVYFYPIIYILLGNRKCDPEHLNCIEE